MHHPVGAVITYRYQELTDSGVPRFASFLRVQSNNAGDESSSAGQQEKSAAKTSEDNSAVSKGGTEMRHFEYEDEKVSKFWEINEDGCEVTVRYGKTGTNGQTRTKTLETTEAAQKHMESMIKEKTRKGYKEC